jgi:Escherichia/Staphylococcus phage prohead protease
METDTRFFDAYDEVPNQRSAQFADLEMTQVRDGYVFDGLASVFDEVADLPEFTEEVKHGAYRRVLSSGVNVPFLHEHDPNYLLGTTRSGRVRLAEEARGLRVMANVVKTDLSERLKALVDGDEVTGMSTGFVVGRGNATITRGKGNKPHRTISSFKKLLDVCTTWDPAYAATEAQFRSLALADPKSSGSLQQLLAGVYPQLEQPGNEPDDQEPPVVEPEEARDSGVSTPLLAARKRRLQLLTITLERGQEL